MSIHNRFDRYSDADLVEMSVNARALAHEAPKNSSNAAFRRAEEWCQIEAEIERRRYHDVGDLP